MSMTRCLGHGAPDLQTAKPKGQLPQTPRRSPCSFHHQPWWAGMPSEAATGAQLLRAAAAASLVSNASKRPKTAALRHHETVTTCKFTCPNSRTQTYPVCRTGVEVCWTFSGATPHIFGRYRPMPRWLGPQIWAGPRLKSELVKTKILPRLAAHKHSCSASGVGELMTYWAPGICRFADPRDLPNENQPAR